MREHPETTVATRLKAYGQVPHRRVRRFSRLASRVRWTADFLCVFRAELGHDAVYASYSGWDIYRSQAQLEALLAAKVASETAQSMVDDYRQTGIFPKWSKNDGESYVMVGDPAAAIIADYYAFGARDFDTADSLEGLAAEAAKPKNNRPDLNYLDSLGYLPHDGNFGCCNAYGPAATNLEYNTPDPSQTFARRRRSAACS
ncbi:glycoside hydrolase domain-containing protein [Amycolatopsis sp. cg13]|uniref:glycoside hydrolase domain-containing protein n=1 Tax=Amycolatopsis sp. cg13 TaxID=3238807 RepID=UPI00352529DF